MLCSESVADRLRGVLEPLGGFGNLHPFDQPQAGETPRHLLIRNRSGRAVAVLLFSSPEEPDVMRRYAERAAQARQALGERLGQVVLPPLASGESEGTSYIVLPFCSPLSRRRGLFHLQRYLLRGRVYRWLREVTARTARPAAGPEIEADFLLPLKALASHTGVNAEVRQAAEAAMRRLEAGHWKPRYVLAHNDLWLGNLLLRKSWPLGPAGEPFPFHVIDWAAARVNGHAIYDLMRFTVDAACPTRQVARELRSHCRLLDCELANARSYLLSALGDLWIRRGNFPEDRFVWTVEQCWKKIGPALH